MLIEAPKIDTRSFEELVAEIKALIPGLLPEWKPGEGDPGLALIKIFSHMTKEVIDRLNQVPQKYFGAFLEMLGVSLLPASAARAPVTFFLSAGADTNVLIPKGTSVAAGEKDVVFETENNIRATPAKLIKIFALDGKKDEIYSLPLEMGNGVELFKGENLQAHILYLGDENLFNTAGNAKYELSGLIGPFEKLTWEYGGEHGWYPFNTVDKTNSKLILALKNTEQIKEQEINGIESKWIRCTYKAGSYGVDQFRMWGVDAGGIKLAKPLAASENEIFPDAVFCNEIPVDLGTEGNPNPIYPFGNRPARYDTIYIGSREALSKKSGQVTLKFEMTADIKQQDQAPRLSWEYGTPGGWKAIRGLQTSDETGYYKFWKSGTVSFECPTDIQPMDIGGQENYWVCVRIIDGDYGKEMVYDTDKQEWLPGVVEPPVIKKITIHYKIPSHYQTEPTNLQHCLTYNNLEYKNLENTPFYPLEDQQRILLLGFDKKIEKGPISIYFSLKEQDDGHDYLKNMSKTGWYYYAGSSGGQWKALETSDHTRGMRESGTVEFFVPLDFVKKSIFKEEIYWLKVVGIMEENDLQPAPKIKGIHLNTTRASQVEFIDDEILGSSDGGTNQEFCLQRTPVVSEEIWVNETGTLTTEEKKAILEQNGESAVREIKDETGSTADVLVRWQAKEDFFGSSSKSRHYVIERANGRVRFGNGLQGMIPPAGRDNIIANYYVGGGTKGNINAFEITDMKTSIPYVDSVSNPEPAEGGADTEQMTGVFKRGPYFIKHRNRAVTGEDFERLAAAASPYIARTKCLKIDNKLKIIVIPGEKKDKPFPSFILVKTVEKHLISRSLNLVSPGCMEVSGPQYVEVNITAEVMPVSIDIAVPLEAEVLKQIRAFLHPLYGGPEKNGWQFGRDLYISDVYALLESIQGVDHVENLLLNGKHDNIKVKPEETLCSGQHRIELSSASLRSWNDGILE